MKYGAAARIAGAGPTGVQQTAATTAGKNLKTFYA